MGKYDDLIAAVGRAAPPPKYIRAYHGSPYDFDRFDASKIGTGEGAQAYGHGLYFAGKEDVARSYRDSLQHLASAPVPDELDDQLMQVSSEIGRLSSQRGKVVGSEWDAIQKQLDQKHALLIDLQRQHRAAAQSPGHMYEVELRVPEGALMDWDAPLSAQPQHFMQVLRAYDAVPELPSSVPWKPVGEQAYRRLIDRISMSGPARKGQMPPGRAAVAAADALMSGGVPGIRYLDAGSRRAGAGTHNYVMFPGTEDQIRILRKHGLLAPMAAGAMEGQE
jgi:hypothetical protein